MKEVNHPDLGLVLTGGGARGAYQVGVLRGLAEIHSEAPSLFSFNVVLGQSAGAINASSLVSSQHDFPAAVEHLYRVWSQLRTEQIYRTDPVALSRNGLRWLQGAAFGAVSGKTLAHSLLDNRPLRKLIEKEYSANAMIKNIESGRYKAFAVTAYDYTNLSSVTYFYSKEIESYAGNFSRKGVNTVVQVDHIMGSSSIPLIFPPTDYEGAFLGDGMLRNTTPISPALHLGAQKLFVVGVRSANWENHMAQPFHKTPSIGRILGIMLNSLFFDATDADMQKLKYINSILKQNPGGTDGRFREVPYFYMQPSQDLATIALEHVKHLPRLISYLMSGLGEPREVAELTSYLLFEPPYLNELLELGYHDVRKRRDEIIAFLSGVTPLVSSI